MKVYIVMENKIAATAFDSLEKANAHKARRTEAYTMEKWKPLKFDMIILEVQ